jgi:hypothetical protein
MKTQNEIVVHIWELTKRYVASKSLPFSFTDEIDTLLAYLDAAHRMQFETRYTAKDWQFYRARIGTPERLHRQMGHSLCVATDNLAKQQKGEVKRFLGRCKALLWLAGDTTLGPTLFNGTYKKTLQRIRAYILAL